MGIGGQNDRGGISGNLTKRNIRHHEDRSRSIGGKFIDICGDCILCGIEDAIAIIEIDCRIRGIEIISAAVSSGSARLLGGAESKVDGIV